MSFFVIQVKLKESVKILWNKSSPVVNNKVLL